MKHVILMLSMLLALSACERAKTVPPSAEEIEAATKDAPEIFVSDPVITLEGLEDFYLGQPQDEALEALGRWCKKLVEFEGGWMRGHTYFKGCSTPDHPFVRSIRIGFHPELDGRVFTVEHRRENVTREVVRARFYQKIGQPQTDLPRPGTLRMSTPRYHMFADWDEGEFAPTHIIIGYNPEHLDEVAR